MKKLILSRLNRCLISLAGVGYDGLNENPYKADIRSGADILPVSLVLYRNYQYDIYLLMRELRRSNNGIPLADAINLLVRDRSYRTEVLPLLEKVKSTTLVLQKVHGRASRHPEYRRDSLTGPRFREIIFNLIYLRHLLQGSLSSSREYDKGEPLSNGIALREFTQLNRAMAASIDALLNQGTPRPPTALLDYLYAQILIAYDFASVLITRIHPPAPGEITFSKELLQEDLTFQTCLESVRRTVYRYDPEAKGMDFLLSFLKSPDLPLERRVRGFLAYFDEFTELGKRWPGPWQSRGVLVWEDEPI